MTEERKGFYCGKHPDFDPYKASSGDNINCSVCQSLQIGARRAGSFGGESKATPQDIDNAKTIIGPLTLKQLGDIRYDLGGDHHFEENGAPSWYLDEENLIIYLRVDLHPNKVKEFKKRGYPIYTRTWEEPTIKFVDTLPKKGGKAALSATIGESGTQFELSIKEGDTESDIRNKIWDLFNILEKTPNDKVETKKL